ncbi:MAG: hypothetical protein F4Y58_03360, partial [Gammaproteobacteria bacterium]|nr:hypothetical protein [Gammaproteobacteria bacterium]
MSATSLGEAAGSTAVTVTATLADGSDTVSIPLSLGGTAVSGTGNDYTFTPATLPTISITNATSGTATINIDPLEDDDGTTETIEVTATVWGYEVTPATITLTDNDLPEITLRLNPASADEDASSTPVTVTATRDASAATAAVTVQLEVDAASTATSGTDYTALGTLPTISLAANQTSNTATIDIDPTDDSTAESGGETIIIGGTATGFDVNTATFTINDDDTPATSVTITVSPDSLGEGAGDTTVTVKAELDGGTLGSNLTVTFHALGGTADGSADYAATDATTGNAKTTPDAVIITMGQTEASTTIKIDPTQDTLDESDGTTARPHETITFDATLSGALTGTGTGKVTTDDLTIVDDDTASTTITLSVDTDAAAGEQSEIGEGDGETEVTVKATLSGSATYLTDQTVAVEVVSVSGGATPSLDATSGDYQLKDFADAAPSSVTLPISLGDITIPAGMSSASDTFKVNPNDDSADEPIETIRVDGTLTGFGVTHADISLTDNDLPKLTLSSTTTSIGEGDGDSGTRVTVTASVDQNVSARVDVTLTFTGSATPGTDYTVTNPTTVTVSIPSGQRTGSVTFTLTPVEDRLDEGTGENIVIGGNAAHYSVATHTITLDDNDVPSTAVVIKLTDNDDVAMNPLERLGEDAGATTVKVTAELNLGTLGSGVTVTFNALGGNAVPGGTDYTSTDTNDNPKTTPSQFTILKGQTEGSTLIKITPIDDDIDEGTGENIIFTATLSGALTGTATQATLRIVDNDTALNTVNLSLDADSGETGDQAEVGEGHTGEATVEVTATVPGGKTHDTATVVDVSVRAPASPRRAATASTSSSSDDYTLKDFAGTSVSDVTLPISLGSITIPAGTSSASRSFRIDPRDDSDFEGTENDAHEYIGIGGQVGDGSVFTVNQADLEITENDNPTITITVDADPNTPGVQDKVPEAAGTRSMSVTLTLGEGARSTATTVNLTFAGMATSGTVCTPGSGTDFVVGNRAVSIPANQASRTVSVSLQVCQDRITETTADETVTINGTATGFDVTGTAITIEDDDSESTTLTISASPSTISEGHTGTRTVTVTATLDGGTVGHPVAVTFDTLAGTAVRGADDTSGDYTSTPAKPVSISIPSGSLSASTTISIDPREDTTDEIDETIVFGASAAKTGGDNASLGVTAGTAIIEDNDSATVTLAADTDTVMTGTQTAIGESAGATTVRVTATLSTTRSQPTTLTLRIDDGTAETTGDRKDYDPSSSLTDTTVDITIAAGSTTGSADVTITPDPVEEDRFDESDETIIIGAAASGGQTLAGDPIALSVTAATVTVTVVDDPSTTVTLKVDTDTVMPGDQTGIGEGDGGASVLVTATLNDAVRSTATTITLTFGGDAVRGSANDYRLSGTLSVTIPANEVSGTETITITPRDERTDDGDKTIAIGGMAPSGSGLGVTAAADIDLADNDDPPTAIELTVDPTSVREQGPAGGGGCPEGAGSPGPGCNTTVTVTASFTGANSDVTLENNTAVTLSVHTDSTATRGSTGDYTAPAALGDANADITIPVGQTSATVDIVFTSRQDNTNEGGETIIIDGAATGFTIAEADRATIDFSDDDAPSTSISLSLFACVDLGGDDCVDTLITFLSERDDFGELKLVAELDGSASTSDIDVTLRIQTPDNEPGTPVDWPSDRDWAPENSATRGGQKDYTASGNLTDTGTMAVDITIPATKASASTTITLAPRVDGVDDDDEVIRIGGSTAETDSINWVRALDIEIRDDEVASTRVDVTKSSGPDSFTEDHGTGVAYTVVATVAGGVAHSTDTAVTLGFGGTAALGTDCAIAGVDYTVSPSPAVVTIAAEATSGDATVTLTPPPPGPRGPRAPPPPPAHGVSGP